MLKRVMVGAVALAAISGVAYAQSTTPPARAQTPPAATTGTTSPAGTPMGMRTADSATLAIRYATVNPANVMSSKLVGINVYNNQNETLGEIADLVIEEGYKITGVVISVGGFLGMGESYVVVDPSTIVLNQKDSTWSAFVNTSKDNLKTAPKFSYSKQRKAS